MTAIANLTVELSKLADTITDASLRTYALELNMYFACNVPHSLDEQNKRDHCSFCGAPNASRPYSLCPDCEEIKYEQDLASQMPYDPMEEMEDYESEEEMMADYGITQEDLDEFRARNEERGTAYGHWY